MSIPMSRLFVSLLLVLVYQGSAFDLGLQHKCSSWRRQVRPQKDGIRRLTALELTSSELEIAGWTAAFATSHIGMSSIRQDLIAVCGAMAENVGMVNRPGWKLPDVWPGDEAGQNIFPNKEIAGRQIYRIGYTAVSFLTLGSALAAYWNSLQNIPSNAQDNSLALWVAATSLALSFASLFNPSPLSLVPSYERGNSDKYIARDDSRKLQPVGLTRITRHPLILPVVPWGLATAVSMGGTPRDFLLFGGLSIYAIAGCVAQDLRVSRQEGSVGTVFTPDKSLQEFFKNTSFLPFGAVVEGRQSLLDIDNEVPWVAITIGLVFGYQLQSIFIAWLQGQL
jgi:uncharacterized membrane protein